MSNSTMLYLIAYDIPQNKTRTRLHKALLCYGKWTQFSFFECHLTPKQFVGMIAEIKGIVDDQSNVRIYTLSRDDADKTITIGSDPPHDEEIYVV